MMQADTGSSSQFAPRNWENDDIFPCPQVEELAARIWRTLQTIPERLKFAGDDMVLREKAYEGALGAVAMELLQ